MHGFYEEDKSREVLVFIPSTVELTRTPPGGVHRSDKLRARHDFCCVWRHGRGTHTLEDSVAAQWTVAISAWPRARVLDADAARHRPSPRVRKRCRSAVCAASRRAILALRQMMARVRVSWGEVLFRNRFVASTSVVENRNFCDPLSRRRKAAVASRT